MMEFAHGQADHVAKLIDLERHLGLRKLAEIREPFNPPRDREPLGRVAFKHIAIGVDPTIFHDQLPRRAHLAVSLDPSTEEVLTRELRGRQGLPEFLGRGNNVNNKYAAGVGVDGINDASPVEGSTCRSTDLSWVSGFSKDSPAIPTKLFRSSAPVVTAERPGRHGSRGRSAL